MNYKLAKQLKDAGFPGLDVPDFKERPLRWPDLSKLIEACGGMFRYLEHNSSHPEIHQWKACSAENDKEWGKTPEEAVANLWLALHRK